MIKRVQSINKCQLLIVWLWINKNNQHPKNNNFLACFLKIGRLLKLIISWGRSILSFEYMRIRFKLGHINHQIEGTFSTWETAISKLSDTHLKTTVSESYQMPKTCKTRCNQISHQQWWELLYQASSAKTCSNSKQVWYGTFVQLRTAFTKHYKDIRKLIISRALFTSHVRIWCTNLSPNSKKYTDKSTSCSYQRHSFCQMSINTFNKLCKLT